VLADGACWIWGMGGEVVPQARQILDFSHAKHYLWEAGKLLYGKGSELFTPVKSESSSCSRIRSSRWSPTSPFPWSAASPGGPRAVLRAEDRHVRRVTDNGLIGRRKGWWFFPANMAGQFDYNRRE
jgi:hypothetical protein